ncbi:hypothetical protein [Capnocytophaga sputigena]|jgi:hypothetical protein|uniref:hypothetical protein n=2 Tax=Capnocytophaga sputigena TaxID=1019 RepID=UPI0028D6AE20|nr:hypothetical protein [Capnocytophaga sputigena]
MNRIEKILESLVCVAGNKISKHIWDYYLRYLNENLIKNTLGQGRFSRFYNCYSNKNFFNEKEHRLIAKLILEIEYFSSNQ